MPKDSSAALTTYCMLYMIIEHFHHGDARPVYARFRERGRLAPDGLEYIASWVTADRIQCFQVMSTEDPRLLDQWMAQWNDLVTFEVITVITSREATGGGDESITGNSWFSRDG